MEGATSGDSEPATPDTPPPSGTHHPLPATSSLVRVSLSRIRILRQLDGAKATVSELGRELGLNKSTVHKHLSELVDEGLVERLENEGRLWVYYQLTETGREIAEEETLTIVLDLADLR